MAKITLELEFDDEILEGIIKVCAEGKVSLADLIVDDVLFMIEMSGMEEGDHIHYGDAVFLRKDDECKKRNRIMRA